MAKRKTTTTPEPDTDLVIGFTGTRSGMTVSQIASLKALLVQLTAGKKWVARHGDCQGADAQFHEIARELGAHSVEVHPPTDDRLRAFCKGDVVYRSQPYAQRNREIVGMSDHIIACPAQSNNPGYGGTWQTVRFAQDADNLYRIIIPNGAVIEP